MRNLVIIGGGPAGSSAAIHLANAGVLVCLLERKHGLHDKVCGEFINSEAARLLSDLGVNLPALGAQTITRLGLHCGDKKRVCDLPTPAWSLSRRVLDAHLLTKARQAGATIETGVTVKDLHQTEQGWDLLCSTQHSLNHQREMQTIKAQTVFLATGKHDIHNWQRGVKNSSNYELIGLKMHLELQPAQREELQHMVEIYFYDGGYAGLEPIENNKANLCFLIRRDIYKNCGGNWPCVAEWLAHTSVHLKARLANARAIWAKPLAISAVPYGYTHTPADAIAQLFRIGDQTAVIHSLAGDGISMALHSGKLAAQVYLSKGDSRAYYAQTQKLFKKSISNAQLIADVMSTAVGRNIAFFITRYWPGATHAAIAGVRVKAN